MIQKIAWQKATCIVARLFFIYRKQVAYIDAKYFRERKKRKKTRIHGRTGLGFAFFELLVGIRGNTGLMRDTLLTQIAFLPEIAQPVS